MLVDKEIIKACVKGDSKAQYLLYKHAYSLLMKVCYRYANSKDDAVDLLNQGCLKIFNALQQYDPQQSFEAWAKRIMINTIIDNHRRSKSYREQVRLQEREQIEQYDNHSDFNSGENRLMHEDILNLIQQLPPLAKEVLNLSLIDGYTHKEIAELLGITETNSKYHLTAARGKLQQWIKNADMISVNS